MAKPLNFGNIRSEADILPLLIWGGDMGQRSKNAVFKACLNYYLTQHPEIPKGLEKIYFNDFVISQFDGRTLLTPVSGIAFSCLPQAVAGSKKARDRLVEHERAKLNFMGHYREFNLEYK